MPTRKTKKSRKHGRTKREMRPPSDARPPLDYLDEARRAVHAHSPKHDR